MNETMPEALDEQIMYWSSICVGEDPESLLLKSRKHYGKGVCTPREARPGRVSDLIDFSCRINAPDALCKRLMPALNHPQRLTAQIRAREAGVEYISEGLIVTFPIDKLKTAFKKFYKKNIDTAFKNLNIGQVYASPDKRYFQYENQRVQHLERRQLGAHRVCRSILPRRCRNARSSRKTLSTACSSADTICRTYRKCLTSSSSSRLNRRKSSSEQ